MLIPFEVEAASGAEVAWINDAWFLEQGWRLEDERERLRAHEWVIEQFAFVVPGGGSSGEQHRRLFYADRYGAAGTVLHGGSGRCGLSGGFQVKGIGKTPLVSDGADWIHAHGCLWLEEGLREAVASEIVDAEFPLGAVRTIAVIALADRATDDGPEADQQRALLVREDGLRVAHWERATVPARYETEVIRNDLDAGRVRLVAEALLLGGPGATPADARPAVIATLIDRLTRQLAFSVVQRLYNGGVFSSNLGVDGRLIDFGSFRALPLWARLQASPGVPFFGDELRGIQEIARSALQSYRKVASAAQRAAVDEKALQKYVDDQYSEALASEFRMLFGHLDDERDPAIRELGSAMSAYYRMQQRVTVSRNTRIVPDTSIWIGTQIACFVENAQHQRSTPEADRVVGGLRALREKSTAAGFQCAVMRAIRLLTPRPALYREELQELIWSLIDKRDEVPRHGRIGDAITHVLAISRRHWPMLPDGWSVAAQTSDGASGALALIGTDENGMVRRSTWLEGIATSRGIYLFGKLVDSAALEGLERVDRRGRTGFLVAELASDRTIRIPGQLPLELPAFDYHYCPIGVDDATDARSDPSELELDYT